MRHLRLTNRTLWKLGDEHLLPEITAYVHRHSINNIEQIASSRPAIRNAIKSLCFQADETDHEARGSPRVGAIEQFDEWNVARHFAFARDSSRFTSLLAKHGTDTSQDGFDLIDELSEDGINSIPKYGESSRDPVLWAAFEHYRTLAKDELKMRAEAIIRIRFTTLFLACPNLTKLSINLKDILGPNRGFESPEWLRGLRVPHGSVDSGPYVLGQLLLAAHDASLNLRDLSLGIVGLTSTISSERHLMLKAMRKLTRLHWKFEDLHTREHDTADIFSFPAYVFAGSILEVDLAGFSSSCPDLEQLYLDMMYETLVSGRADLRLLLPTGFVLKSLRRVRLTNFRATPGRLSAFMLDHAATLQYFHLHNVHLYDVEDEDQQWQEQFDEHGIYWQTCIEAFAGKMTALTKVKLTGRFTSYARNGMWYYGRKLRSSSGEDGYERDSSEVIDFILTGTSQYNFPAPSFDGQVVNPSLSPELQEQDDDETSTSGTSSLDEEIDVFEGIFGPYESEEGESEDEDED